MLFAFNARFSQGEFLQKIVHQAGIPINLLIILIHIAVVVILKFPEQDDTASFLVPKSCNGCINTFLQVAEADNIAKSLYAVQDAVGTAEGLNKTVHFKVLIHPEGIQGGSIKSCQEHIDHNQEIKLLVLHSQGNILVVALELIAIGGIICAEHGIVVSYGLFQKVPVCLGKGGSIFRIFLIQNTICFFLVSSIAINNSYTQLLGMVGSHLLPELIIIHLCHRH